jgi:hypothetical protein
LAPGYIYGFKGGATDYYYCYDIADASWQACETIPHGPENRTVGWGGALTCRDGMIYALKGYSSQGFWAYTPNPAHPGRPLGGGAMAQTVSPAPCQAWLRVGSPAIRDILFSYGLSQASAITIRLYDLSGRCVKQVSEQPDAAPGAHLCHLDGSDLATGVYIVQLKVGNQRLRQKVVVQK